MLQFPEMLTLWSGTTLNTLYRWAMNKGHVAKQNLEQFAPKFLTEHSTVSTLKRYLPTNFTFSLNSRITKEKLIDFFDMGDPLLLSRDMDYYATNYNRKHANTFMTKN